MENKLSLSIILPIKSSKSRDFNEYFEKAMNSDYPSTVPKVSNKINDILKILNND